MRIFGKADASIDRFDRAEWFTWPFDGAFPAPVAPEADSERVFTYEPRVPVFTYHDRTPVFTFEPRSTVFAMEDE